MIETIAISLVCSLVTGAVTGVGVVAAIKTDVRWLKESNSRAHMRIDDIEKRI